MPIQRQRLKAAGGRGSFRRFRFLSAPKNSICLSVAIRPVKDLSMMPSSVFSGGRCRDKACVMEKKTSTKFRELLNRRQLLVMSGGFSPLHARMSEVLGYEAFFMSGSQVCAYVYGYPDVGLPRLERNVRSSAPPNRRLQYSDLRRRRHRLR